VTDAPRDDPPRRLLGRALRYIARKDRTEREMELYLLRRRTNPDEVRKVMEYLRRWGYLDDVRVALNWGRDRIDHAHWGPARLAQELGRRGVDPEIIQGVVGELFSQRTEEELARGAAEHYLRTHPGLGGERKMRRLAGYLGRRGYSPQLIRKIVLEWCTQNRTLEP